MRHMKLVGFREPPYVPPDSKGRGAGALRLELQLYYISYGSNIHPNLFLSSIRTYVVELHCLVDERFS